jgi:dihydropyrimidinase
MSKAACQEIERAKAKGINVYGEPLAVALACDGREMYDPDWRHAAGYVMSPPLREDPDTKGER